MENKSFADKMFGIIFWGTLAAAFAWGGSTVLGYSPVVSTILSYVVAAGVIFTTDEE